jgi:hypothetical protein
MLASMREKEVEFFQQLNRKGSTCSKINLQFKSKEMEKSYVEMFYKQQKDFLKCFTVFLSLFQILAISVTVSMVIESQDMECKLENLEN